MLGKHADSFIGKNFRKTPNSEIGKWGNGEIQKSSSKGKCGVIRLCAARLRRDEGE